MKTAVIDGCSHSDQLQRMGDSPTASSSGDRTPPKKKQMWYSQSFNEDWLTDPELEDWIKLDLRDKFVVHCVVCESKLKNSS